MLVGGHDALPHVVAVVADQHRALHALQIGEASKVIPIDKFSVVISMVLAFLVLGEKVTVTKVLGGALIAAGTFVLIL